MKEFSGIKQKKGIKTIYTNNYLIYININIYMSVYIHICFSKAILNPTTYGIYTDLSFMKNTYNRLKPFSLLKNCFCSMLQQNA